MYITAGEFEIAGNTIVANGVATGGIAIDAAAPSGGGGRDFAISGNYLNGAQSATGSIGIRMRTTGSGTWASGTISGNTFRFVAVCIDVDGGISWVHVSGNNAQGIPGITVGNTVSAFSASANYFSNDAGTAIYVLSGSGSLVVQSTEAQNLAQLPNAQNGSVMYCADGTIANPVAGGGSGCIAKRLNGAWVGN
jgi:hypothetical protein